MGIDLWHWKFWIENLLMMFPLGILLYILRKPFCGIGWSLLPGALFSVSIECTQLITRRGRFETDDIMNNIFGLLAGFMVCKGISGMVRYVNNYLHKRDLDNTTSNRWMCWIFIIL